MPKPKPVTAVKCRARARKYPRTVSIVPVGSPSSVRQLISKVLKPFDDWENAVVEFRCDTSGSEPMLAIMVHK